MFLWSNAGFTCVLDVSYFAQACDFLARAFRERFLLLQVAALSCHFCACEGEDSP